MNSQEIKINQIESYKLTGLFSMALRLVVGWTYFSAFWRRLVLANKLDPETAGYLGEKFNHFLPNALGIKPVIEFLVTNPDLLWFAMVAFTIIEGIVGLLFMLGFFTRLMSLAVFGLAMGILLGSGWIGTTCLDEWQIGILGIAVGFTIFLTGSGDFSVDNWFKSKSFSISNKKWFNWIASGPLPIDYAKLKPLVIGGSTIILFISLFTNQYFHGGVWGTLHNKSVKPKIEIAQANINNSNLSFELSRVEGVDVYGSFLIGISLVDTNGNELIKLDGEDLAKIPSTSIENYYVAKVKPGKHSLIIPLGAEAILTLESSKLRGIIKGEYQLILTDISGATWTKTIAY